MPVNENTSRFVEAINVIHSKIIYLQLDSSSELGTTYIWKTWLRCGRDRSQSEDSTSNTEKASYPGLFQDSGEITVPEVPRLANGTMSCRKTSLTSHFSSLSRRTPRSSPKIATWSRCWIIHCSSQGASYSWLVINPQVYQLHYPEA